ncbi:hypothetical protein OBBRIDRAFT_891193 [Obba rivulosa]|uniref:Nephrocystin 3-like N-terminal domain-containing protein n=1 Tax=Obba rivulosa TaxID=1052685 RepID=A0A8E2AND9_9APHY|nr:hypothetical protein OBBRIDRAFT_891193 [Obba rivulosa]
MASQLQQSPQSSQFESYHNRLDALLTTAKGALGIAADVSSDLPIPGLNNAFSALEQVLGRVEKMRSNKQEAKDAVLSIKALRTVLLSSANSLRSQTTSIKQSEHHAARQTLESSDILNDRITALSNQLVEVQNIAEVLPKRKRWSRLVYTQQDADLLRTIRSRVDEAKENFKLQGGIAIEDLLREVSYRLQRTEHDRLLRDYNNYLEKLNPADASYRSSLTDEKSRLQSGTRENILHDLAEWAMEKEPACRVLVLHGRAGMGKSSIVHALVKRLDESRRGASFFFNRGVPECSDAYRVFPAIAYQLAYSHQALVALIAEASQGHLSRSRSQALEHQLEDLVIHPLSQLPPSTLPLLLALDGADECSIERGDAVSRMLQLLCRAAGRISFLRILIATRPETYIMDALHSSPEAKIIGYRDLQQEQDIDQDIRLFIRTELTNTASRGGFALLEERSDAVEDLTNLADGLFIYASTVVRFLSRDKHQAIRIYDTLLGSQGRLGPNRMYEKLDMLYSTILDNAFGDIRNDKERMDYVHRALCWMVLQKADSVSLSPAYVNSKGLALVGIPTYITLDVIDRLRSVLEVDDEVTLTTELRTCHASFPQFLTDNTRCRDPAFFVDPQSGRSFIATSLIDLLDSDIVRSLHDADSHTQWMWKYATLAWDKHIIKARYTQQLGQSLRRFAETHLEQWIACAEPWGGSDWSAHLVVDLAQSVQEWYKEHNGADEGLTLLLTGIIDKRVKSLAESTLQPTEDVDNWED